MVVLKKDGVIEGKGLVCGPHVTTSLPELYEEAYLEPDPHLVRKGPGRKERAYY